MNRSEPSGNLDDLILLVGRIDGKMDQMLKQHEANTVRLGTLETRITVLERDRNRLAGALALVTGVIGWITKDGFASHLATLFH